MSNIVGSILRKYTREKGEPLNVLCMPTNPEYDCAIANTTKHNFYSLCTGKTKKWTGKEVPKNYIFLEQPEDNKISLPSHIDFDVVIIQNQKEQASIGLSIAKHLQLPIINVIHKKEQPIFGDYNIDSSKEQKWEKILDKIYTHKYSYKLQMEL